MPKTKKRYGTRRYDRVFKEQTPKQQYEVVLNGKRYVTTATGRGQATHALIVQYTKDTGDEIAYRDVVDRVRLAEAEPSKSTLYEKLVPIEQRYERIKAASIRAATKRETAQEANLQPKEQIELFGPHKS